MINPFKSAGFRHFTVAFFVGIFLVTIVVFFYRPDNRAHTAQDPDSSPPVRIPASGGSPSVTFQSPSTKAPRDLFEEILALQANEPAQTVILLASLVSIEDAGVREMWAYLLRTAPRLDGPASLMAAYLWQRMDAIEPGTPMPDGWELDRFNLAAEEQREELHANIHQRLLAGELVTDDERKLFFAEEISRDPLAAVNLWVALTRDGDSVRELSLFARAFMDEALRDKLLAAITAWNAKQQHPASEAFLLSILMEDWLASSPAEVEQWLSSPERASLRDELLGNLATQMAGDDPIKAWEWSAKLPEAQRLSAQITTLTEMAIRDPEMGIKQLESVKDEAARKELVKTFSLHHSVGDYDQWQTWRDSLPSKTEQDSANVAAFETWMSRSLEDALQWLGTFEGPQRMDLLSSMALRNSSNDPDGVAAWIKSLSTPEQRKEVGAAALRGIPQSDQKAMETILNAMK